MRHHTISTGGPDFSEFYHNEKITRFHVEKKRQVHHKLESKHSNIGINRMPSYAKEANRYAVNIQSYFQAVELIL
ncbi:hypothetical protein Plhal304r1_c015g0054761 [Plasmopara halstedii]